MADQLITLEETKRVYEYTRDAYNRAGYVELKPFDEHGNEEQELMRKVVEMKMKEHNVDTAVELLEFLYKNEERAMNIIMERDKEKENYPDWRE